MIVNTKYFAHNVGNFHSKIAHIILNDCTRHLIKI